MLNALPAVLRNSISFLAPALILYICYVVVMRTPPPSLRANSSTARMRDRYEFFKASEAAQSIADAPSPTANVVHKSQVRWPRRRCRRPPARPAVPVRGVATAKAGWFASQAQPLRAHLGPQKLRCNSGRCDRQSAGGASGGASVASRPSSTARY